MPEGAAKSVSSYCILGYTLEIRPSTAGNRKVQITIPGKENIIGRLDYRAGYFGNKQFGPYGGKQSAARYRPASSGSLMTIN